MEPVRWGVLGNAKIAREHLIPAMLLARNARVVALASRDDVAAREVCTRFAIPRLHSGYEDLLADPAVEAVYIPLPTSMHVEWTLAAIAAGKHVLCEKPIAMHATEVDRLIAARDASGLVVGEGFMVVHHPQWLQVRDLLAAGRIGRVRLVESTFTYFNVDPRNMRNRLELGGGALRDIGVYPVVTVRTATGREPVSALARIERDPTFGTDRMAWCRLDFGDFELSFHVSTQLARRQQVTFHGEQGWIRLDAPFNAGVYDVARVIVRNENGKPQEESIYPTANHYVLLVENFGDAVRGKAALGFTLESSRANQRAIDMLFEAGEGVAQCATATGGGVS